MSRDVDGSNKAQTMTWPQIGSDIIAVDNTLTEHPLLAVLCNDERDSDLWGPNFNLVSEGLDMSIMTLNDTWDEDILSSLKQHGGSWTSNHVCVLSITEGKHTGCRAVGVGSNVKKRKKAARLAMVATLAILDGGEVISVLQHFVARAKIAILLGNDLPTGSPPFAKDPCPATPPATKNETTVNDSVEDTDGGPILASDRPHTMIDPSAPRECLEDPFSELRVWTEAENGHPAVLWPYCAKCRCWTDLNHHRSKHHQRALASVHPDKIPPESRQKANAKQSDTIMSSPPMNTPSMVQVNTNTSIGLAAAAAAAAAHAADAKTTAAATTVASSSPTDAKAPATINEFLSSAGQQTTASIDGIRNKPSHAGGSTRRRGR
mmetsp:Transcript_51631/g.99796  ORF Transcript_51631/g.99796 Transcript_51631/m.99796 type:complete len:377 (+) Transcript_51631:57-1187(+)